jgi:hypothetical protein
LRITAFNSDLSTDEIENMMNRWANMSGWKPQILILDYMERMKPNGDGYSRKAEWQWMGAIAKDLVRFSRQHNIITWTACQTNRSGFVKEAELSMEMAQGSKRHFDEAAVVLGIRKTWGTDREEAMEIVCLKNRHGKSDDKPICLKCNLETMYISEVKVDRLLRRDDPLPDEDTPEGGTVKKSSRIPANPSRKK